MGLHKKSMYMTGKPEGTGNVRGLAGSNRLLQLLVGTVGVTRRHTTSESPYTFRTGRETGERPRAWKKTKRRHIFFFQPLKLFESQMETFF